MSEPAAGTDQAARSAGAGGGPAGEKAVIAKPELGRLIDRLWEAGYTVVGPTVAQNAIVLDEVRRIEQLPIGWTDEQEAGTYRLKRRDDDAYFGYAVGPHSWKQYLFPSRLTLLSVHRSASGLDVQPDPGTLPGAVPQYAFLGVRGCDLRAIEVQDRTFLHGPFPDPHYRARRERAFIVALNCGVAAATCFCTSMGTGPKAAGGFDLALTELAGGFLVEVGTERGGRLLASLDRHEPTEAELREAQQVVEGATGQIRRRMETADLPGMLYERLDHPRWDDVAERCLSCANCTMVCPTCFCHSVEEVPDLDGQRAGRVRLWDSCFNPAHGHTAGGSARPDIRSRYRQWLTHKLASWIDQFGTSGCVGCGRCITWCPAAIDITEELAALREPAREVPEAAAAAGRTP